MARTVLYLSAKERKTCLSDLRPDKRQNTGGSCVQNSVRTGAPSSGDMPFAVLFLYDGGAIPDVARQSPRRISRAAAELRKPFPVHALCSVALDVTLQG